MTSLAEKLDFSHSAPPLPPGASQQIFDLARGVTSAAMAEEVLAQLEPLLNRFRADRHLALASGLLMERLRREKDMRAVWSALQERFPQDPLALRMLMRWLRRDGRVDEGLARIARHYPDCWRALPQARIALPGLIELKAWAELDQLWSTLSVLHPTDRAIRMDYIKALAEQSRFPEAAKVADAVHGRDRMGAASQDLLARVEAQAEMMGRYDLEQSAAAIDAIFARAPARRPLNRARRMVFFSGQLGTGGAERQMTRIACAFLDRAALVGDPLPEVWVKHANPATGSDFYRPMLAEAGVPTRVFSEEEEIAVAALDGLTPELRDLLSLLAPDVKRHTCQLLQAFRAHRTEVAYLWQDGGIVQSAIAAVLAGVPRIVTSFRGLPPNLRPNFWRPELPVLYKALAAMPHVTFTANSQKAATAYEDWLELAPGTVQVIPNAVKVMPPEGDDEDRAAWFDILERSAPCTRTVVGVFRFDENKRPLRWIEAAARYLAKRDDTRFVMLGSGGLFPDAQAKIAELGLQDRVFALGIRSKVGFYMHRADLLMHLAAMEGLPNVLIEAQLVGTPVLATPAGGTDEVVEQGVTGTILSDAETLPEEELDTRLAQMLDDPDRLARYGALAMAHSIDRFSVETILDRTAELFENPR